MTGWQMPPGTFADEDPFDKRYPLHVQRAFIPVYFEAIEIAYKDEPYLSYDILREKAIQAFATQWGGLSDENLLRALQQGKGLDRLVAIFAVGQSPLAEAKNLIAPFLQSANQLERCAAAIMLTLCKDERAIPVLEEYLLTDPPPDPQRRHRSAPEAFWWYLLYQSHLARVLANWGPATLTPILKKALLRLWQKEQQRGLDPEEYFAQETLLYALGRRGALASLHGIPLQLERRRYPMKSYAMNYLALGYVRADERFENLLSAMATNEDDLQEEVKLVLAEYFALSEQESQECIQLFGSMYYASLTASGTKI